MSDLSAVLNILEKISKFTNSVSLTPGFTYFQGPDYVARIESGDVPNLSINNFIGNFINIAKTLNEESLIRIENDQIFIQDNNSEIMLIDSMPQDTEFCESIFQTLSKGNCINVVNETNRAQFNNVIKQISIFNPDTICISSDSISFKTCTGDRASSKLSNNLSSKIEIPGGFIKTLKSIDSIEVYDNPSSEHVRLLIRFGDIEFVIPGKKLDFVI